MDIQHIADQLEIIVLLIAYALPVDGKDWVAYRSLFTDDVHIDYSSAGAIAGARTRSPTGWSRCSA